MKLFVRLWIILAWIALICIALYSPRFTFFHSKKDKINVFAWGDILDTNIIKDFERSSGIKVNLSYYSSNEELLVKLKATKGEGYDLIIPSDYAVSLLREDHLLQPLDKSRLLFWDQLNPALLDHKFDPDNRYSIPLEWEIYGLGIDTEFFSNRSFKEDWALIFDKNNVDYKIAMTNDPAEAIVLAATYLFKNTSSLNKDRLAAVKSLLLEQKQWVEAYVTFRGDYFLITKNCPVAVASSSYIWRTIKLFPHIDFFVPKKSFITIENICIPKSSDKIDLIYKFINFLYEPGIIEHHFKLFGFFPPTKIDLANEADKDKLQKWLSITKEEIKEFDFVKPLISQQEMRDLWVELKR